VLSDVCLSDVCRVHLALVENREAYRKTKIGTEVAQVTRDSDTTFKVKKSKVNLWVSIDVYRRDQIVQIA